MSSLAEPRRKTIALGQEVRNALLLSGASETPARIVLVFHAPRVAKLQGGRVPGWRWESTSGLLSRRLANALVLVREDPKAKVPEEVVVAGQGDPLQLARILLDVQKGFVHVHPTRSLVARGATQAPPEPAPKVADHATYQSVMRRVLDGLPRTPLTRAREFFFDLDRHTEPDLVAANPFGTPSAADGKRTLAAVDFVRRALTVRMTARIREHRSTPFRSTPFADPLSFRPMVARVSDVFLGLLWKHFPDGAGGLEHDAVEEAFELFACGELRLWLEELDVWTTEPTSGAFFLFGEFALLAIECDVEPATWTRLGRVLVRAQRLFGRTYPATADRPRLADFAAANHDPDGRPTPSERAALRAVYSELGPAELSIAALRNLELVAPGELDLADPPTGVLAPQPRTEGSPRPAKDGRARAGTAPRTSSGAEK